jgi:hypothetical protein
MDWDTAVTNLSLIVNRDRHYESAGPRLAAALARRDAARAAPELAAGPTAMAHYPPRPSAPNEGHWGAPKQPGTDVEPIGGASTTRRAALIALLVGIGWLLVLVVYGSSLSEPHQLAHVFPVPPYRFSSRW